MSFEELTDELYAQPPAGFVARRDELAREAKTGGDKDLAARIRALRRPTTGAWYLNAAARSSLTSLRELLNLGHDLREAQSGGDFAAVRALAAKRNPLVARVVRDTAAHLATIGVTATASGLDEVRGTLAGVLADPAVAELVEQGRLDGPHTYAGFGDLTFVVPDAPAVAPEPPAPEPEPADRAREEERAAAEAALAEAATRRRAAEDEVRSARELVEAVAAQLARREDELDAAERRLAEAEKEQAAAAQRVEQVTS